MNTKPKKCWFCAKVGKCLKLNECDQFVPYKPSKIQEAENIEKPAPPDETRLNQSEMAALCKISRPFLYYMMHRWGEARTLAEIKRLTGRSFIIDRTVNQADKRAIFKEVKK